MMQGLTCSSAAKAMVGQAVQRTLNVAMMADVYSGCAENPVAVKVTFLAAMMRLQTAEACRVRQDRCSKRASSSSTSCSCWMAF